VDKLALDILTMLTPDLAKREYQTEHPLSGLCYVASETYYHLAGGAEAGLQPYRLTHEGKPHWYLQSANWDVIDLTADQFDTPIRYATGRRSAFLTKKPSKRAQIVIDRVFGLWADEAEV
jgi:hypothetical protein